MRTVVLLTGALRTIKKTIRYFKQNVLRVDVDVFLCVQNDTTQSNGEWTAWFRDHLGDHMKSIEWFALADHPEWMKQREHLLASMDIGEGWKHYLRTSGSMIEYFQLHLANRTVCLYEQRHQFQYDYVVRARTDSIYAKPVDFHWLSWTDEEVSQRLRRVQSEMIRCGFDVTETSLLHYFMSTLLSDDTIPHLGTILTSNVLHEADSPPLGAAPSVWNQYLKNGRYILTIRKNNLYLIRRNLFFMIPSLGTCYGLPRSPAADDIWFNAECQFRSACYYSGISIYEYSTVFEETSLDDVVRWQESDFFDEKGDVKTMVYCVVRK